ncbi:hypothetical protein [Streptomyces sp. NRRL S-350]|uniref:hypothetical protein n=1 Tax=Streptomyces sp. NRRL S-350 TaxID=1463902 RepID=UPI00068D0258|nr:hypothetical protein [Streptomyces sp. NRRL S-350]
MALIAIASPKNAPGTSTTALALAAVWPRRSLYAEAGEWGGDLVYRRPIAESGETLDPSTGMSSLGLAARRGLSPSIVWEHTQRLQGGQEVLLGLATAEQATAWTGLWPQLGRALAALPEIDVVADLGRIGPNSPTLELLPAASVVLLIARTEAEDLAAVRDRAAAVTARLSPNGTVGPPVGIVLVAPRKEQVPAAGGLRQLLANARVPADVLGLIDEDPSGAAQVAGRKGGNVARSHLLRSTRVLAATLGDRYSLGRQPAAAPDDAPATTARQEIR